jgi:hypothetical protein
MPRLNRRLYRAISERIAAAISFQIRRFLKAGSVLGHASLPDRPRVPSEARGSGSPAVGFPR